MKQMKRYLSEEKINRYTLLIVDAKNITNCSEATGIINQTLNRIIKTRFATDEQIALLDDYCSKVELV
jgi:hypothetical protein